MVISELNNKYHLRAPKVPVVPEKVYVSDVISDLRSMKSVPVGINKDTIMPEMFNFEDNYVTLLASNDESNIPLFAKALTSILAKLDNNNVLVFDADSSMQEKFGENVNYINDGIDDVMKKICDSMENQYNEYVKAGYSLKNISNTRSMTVIMIDYAKLLNRLADDNKKRFFDLLGKCKELKKFVFVIADSSSNLKKFEYETWYKSSVSSNYGIWIGNGIADQNLIKTNIGFKKTNNEIPEGYGIVVKNTKTNLVNMITLDFKENKEEDVI